MNDRFYVSTGRTNGYFTIRVSFDELVWSKNECGNAESRVERRDQYVCSLGNKPETAKANLGKWLVNHPGVQVEGAEKIDAGLRDIERGGGEVFPAGKYAGQKPADVYVVDPDYCKWAYVAFNGKKHVTLHRALEALVGAEVQQERRERDEAKAIAAKQAIEVARENEWLVNVLLPLANTSNFCNSVAVDLGAGWLALSKLDQTKYAEVSTNPATGQFEHADEVFRGQLREVSNRFGLAYLFEGGELSPNHPLPKPARSLSPRCLEILAEIYAKDAGHRRRSKNFEAKVEEFWSKIEDVK